MPYWLLFKPHYTSSRVVRRRLCERLPEEIRNCRCLLSESIGNSSWLARGSTQSRPGPLQAGAGGGSSGFVSPGCRRRRSGTATRGNCRDHPRKPVKRQPIYTRCAANLGGTPTPPNRMLKKGRRGPLRAGTDSRLSVLRYARPKYPTKHDVQLPLAGAESPGGPPLT